ncbi:Fe-Mn family superoxide dismutase [Nostocaceae cyanobacterium CENA369]|uniref:superoxide dismutase n=1 Tax=Dendronalium phyllosphericum CENA369 TaxID=1725256 RepID=A0A8J7I1V2_9NOST|nr:Fe-Mn family superoxide dismutase [Dendronalium phyllosphericum CENA369]
MKGWFTKTHATLSFNIKAEVKKIVECGGRNIQSTGAIADIINDNFSDFETFKQRFNDAGAKQFGSGWVWLVRTPNNKFEITSTPNQNNPITSNSFPIMGNDVWEHAYYLKYQNRRPEYLKQWWNIVNWNEINKRLQMSIH